MIEDDMALKRLFENAAKGSKSSYEDFCDFIFDSLYALAEPVYEDEDAGVEAVRQVLDKMHERLGEYNGKENIKLWTARFATAELYHQYCNAYGELFPENTGDGEYAYDNIAQDTELSACAFQYNQFFTNKRKAQKLRGVFENLTKGQIILYELFCYEQCSIEDMEDLLEVDSACIGSELTAMRDVLLYGRRVKPAQAVQQEEELRMVREDEIAELEEVEEETHKSSFLPFIPAKLLKALSIVLPSAAVVLLVIIVASVSAGKKNESSKKSLSTAPVNTSTAVHATTAAAPTTQQAAGTTAQETKATPAPATKAPPAAHSPATEPAATEPPTTESPSTEPPATESPSTEPTTQESTPAPTPAESDSSTEQPETPESGAAGGAENAGAV